jgi:hypothetical protein
MAPLAGEAIVKLVKVEWQRRKAVQDRLERWQKDPPTRVSKVLSYGWLPSLPGSVSSCLRLSFARIRGVSLHQCWPKLATADRKNAEVQAAIVAELWHREGFVHGDISPRNILFDTSCKQIWFIDCALDVASPQGTPAFWTGEPRNHATDRFALRASFRFLAERKD